MNPTDALNIVLGAGGIAFGTAAYRVYKDWREGTWRRQDTAIADLERWRSDADDAREWEALQHSWWRGWAGRLEWVILVRLGADHLPERPPYPEKPDSGTSQATETRRERRRLRGR